jgi:hypothetical protein
MRVRIAAISLGLACLLGGVALERACAEEQVAPNGRRVEVRRPSHRSTSGRQAGTVSSSRWWLVVAGTAVVCATCGWLSLASKRGRLGLARTRPALEVVGRASLSPRHSVYLLRAGERVLIVGAGAQGPPALLGEITDSQELARFVEPRAAGSPSGEFEFADGGTR